MHPDPAFRIDDADAMRAFVAARAFAHLFAAGADGPVVAHAPVTLTARGDLRFHLARRNPAAALIGGARGVASVSAADGYVSPDWYAVADQVPTWNYVAVEAHGRFRRLNDADAIAQLDALSADHEARLAPKPAWTRHEMTAGRFDAMARGLIGFELEVTAWHGTAKLSQNKPAEVRARVAAALSDRGETRLAALVADPGRVGAPE